VVTIKDKFIIFQEKQGLREDYKTEIGIETVKEEVKRLNNLDDGIEYGYRKQNRLKPEEPQSNRLYWVMSNKNTRRLDGCIYQTEDNQISLNLNHFKVTTEKQTIRSIYDSKVTNQKWKTWF